VPVEPGFAMMEHLTYGQSTQRVIIDLTGCVGTEPPCVIATRATSLDGLVVLRKFDQKHITKRYSEDMKKELTRLLYLKRKTISNCGDENEVQEAGR
jgi:hypothetical protein